MHRKLTSTLGMSRAAAKKHGGPNSERGICGWVRRPATAISGFHEHLPSVELPVSNPESQPLFE